MQESKDGQNVNWHLLDSSRDDQNDKLSLCTWGIQGLHGVYNTGQKCTDEQLHKLPKSCFSISKKLFN